MKELECIWGNIPSERSCKHCGVACSSRVPKNSSYSSTDFASADFKNDAIGLSIMLYLETNLKNENSKVCGVPLKIAREWLREHINDQPINISSEWGADHLRDSTKMVDEGLAEAAEEYIKKGRYLPEAFVVRPAFIAGAEYQRKQDQGLIELAEDHAMLAGMNKMKEEMMEKIKSRISEILGDAQPNPVLRMELQGIIDKIKNCI